MSVTFSAPSVRAADKLAVLFHQEWERFADVDAAPSVVEKHRPEPVLPLLLDEPMPTLLEEPLPLLVDEHMPILLEEPLPVVTDADRCPLCGSVAKRR